MKNKSLRLQTTIMDNSTRSCTHLLSTHQLLSKSNIDLPQMLDDNDDLYSDGD
jgi:hypothetical protein